MPNPYRENVKRGAALLDKHFGKPNWRKKCEGFEMDCTRRCILGKLFGSFSNGMQDLRLDDGTPRLVEYYGFDGSDFKLLQEAWEDEFANPPLGTDDE